MTWWNKVFMRCPQARGRKGLDTQPWSQGKCELGIHSWREVVIYSRPGDLDKEVALGERGEGGGVSTMGNSHMEKWDKGGATGKTRVGQCLGTKR